MDIDLLLVPYDTALRGWRMGAGPERLVEAGLIHHLEALGHTVRASTVEPERGDPAEIRTAFELMRAVAQKVRTAVDQGRFPLVLSGNCNTATGTLAGLAPASRAVFWFDAHADCNTPETTGSGFLDGTSLATSLGWCWRELAHTVPGFQPVPDHNVLLLGTRDIDPLERDLLARSAVRVLPSDSLRHGGLAHELPSICQHADIAYVHCDLDALDPAEGQANPFPVPGGLTVAEVESTVREIGRSLPIKAAAVTAYAPEYDSDGRIAQAALRIIETLLAVAGDALRRPSD